MTSSTPTPKDLGLTFIGFTVAGILLFAFAPLILVIGGVVWLLYNSKKRQLHREFAEKERHLDERAQVVSSFSTSDSDIPRKRAKVADPLADLGDDPFIATGPDALRQERCATCKQGWVLYDASGTVLTACRKCVPLT